MKVAKLAVGLSSKWQCVSSRSTPQKVGNTNQRDVRSRAKRSTLSHYLSHSLHLFLSKSFPFSLSLTFCLSFSSCQQTHEVHTKLCWCLKVCHEIKMPQHEMLVKSRAHTRTHTHSLIHMQALSRAQPLEINYVKFFCCLCCCCRWVAQKFSPKSSALGQTSQ